MLHQVPLHGTLFPCYKWLFYCVKLAWCLWLDLSVMNLPQEISMVTSERRKKPPVTFNSGGFSIPKAREPIRFLQLTPTWKTTKMFNGFLFRCWEKDGWWHRRFYVADESKRKILGQNFELVRWARFRSDISEKYVLLLACNWTVGCSWTVKWNLRSRLKQTLCTFAQD